MDRRWRQAGRRAPEPAGQAGRAGGRDSAAARPDALMTQRLQSFVPSHRKDAAYALGQSGDPRAIPSLIHVLKYDLIEGRANRLGDRAG